jgi:hypothetical protein
MIVDANLVDRSNGKAVSLLSLGKVVHGFLDFLEIVLAKDYWKYTVIDSLTNTDPPLPAEERTKIVLLLWRVRIRQRYYCTNRNVLGISKMEQ